MDNTVIEISEPVTRPFQAIQNALEQSIRVRELVTGDRLPSERELQERFGCTRITAREALMRLAARGLIYRQPRRGWFVAPSRFVCNPARRMHFLHDARSQGFAPATQLISCHKIRATGLVQDTLDCEYVYQLLRLRLLDGRSVLLENLYLAEPHFPDLDRQELNGSLTELLRDHYNIWIAGEEARIRSTALDDDQAQQLHVSAGTPAIQIERTRFDRNNRAVEFDCDYWLHDAIELHTRS